MATHTTNYNLEKPEASDPFGDFRQSYNSNMDIIDQNLGGGGGGGGHTIIDPNGSDMAQRAGLQFTGSCSVTDDAVNDKTIVNISGGGGNVYGAFIDTSQVIKSQTVFVGTMSYQATKDCFVSLALTTRSNASALVKIDGVTVQSVYLPSGTNALGLLVGLKSGQTLSVADADNNNNSAYTVYGVTQGTSGIFAPVIYSDTERKIGIWRDNKPLYQRTWHNLAISITANTWANTGISATDIETIVSGTMQDDNDQKIGGTIGFMSSHAYIGVNPQIGNRDLSSLTLQYTKISDVAGSGDWNTDGVPTVHYDTSEKVIGTWFGKPLYEKTIVKNNIEMGNNGGTLTSIAHGVSDLKECVRLNMSCPKLGYCTGDNLTSTAGVVIATFRVDGTSVYCSGGTNYFGATNDRYWYITIQYTKTTD